MCWEGRARRKLATSMPVHPLPPPPPGGPCPPPALLAAKNQINMGLAAANLLCAATFLYSDNPTTQVRGWGWGWGG